MSSVPVPVNEDSPRPAGALALATGGRSLADMKSWLKELKAFVLDILVEGVDYGAEPGIPDKFLHKPGSEKLMMVYGLTAEFYPIESDTIRDWTATPPHIQLAFRCVLIHRASGAKAGEGSGIASSWESKYKYRAEWWNNQGKEPPAGEGWKKTKNGYRKQTINTDISDSVNTIIKMAQKRAQVDAVLRVTATSQFFKQELDDTTRADENEPAPPPEDPAITKLFADMLARIKVSSHAALPDLAAEIAKDPILSRKSTKAWKNPLRAAYKERHDETKPKPDAAPAPPAASAASPSTSAKPKAPEQPTLPGAEPEPGADLDEDEDPGPPE